MDKELIIIHSGSISLQVIKKFMFSEQIMALASISNT
jgi:hypothetical protein